MRKLIYDINSSAHLPDFIIYILKYLNSVNDRENDFIIMINSKVFSQVKKEYDIANTRVKFIVIPDLILNNINNSIYFIRYFKELFYLKKIIKEQNIDQLIFLQIDIYQILIWFLNFTNNIKIRIDGILLGPPSYLSYASLKYIRKYIQIKILLTSKNVNKIYLLNDMYGTRRLNTIFKTNVFQFLPDPIDFLINNVYHSRCGSNITNESRIFLLIGGMSERKNLINIISAVKKIDREHISNFKLMICGKFYNKSYLELVRKNITEDILENVIIVDEYLSKYDYDYFMSISDFVLVLYKDFNFSSNVLGHAVKHSKPIIATNKGVINEIVNNYKLGVTISPDSIFELSIIFNRYLRENKTKIDITERKIFLNKHSYLEFSRILLTN